MSVLIAGVLACSSSPTGTNDASPNGRDSSEARCGDGVCQSTETPAGGTNECPSDCHCISAGVDVCVGDNVCIADICKLAFGRTYNVIGLGAKVAATNSQAQPWDTAVGSLGAPDLYVEVLVNGVSVAKTGMVADSLEPSWEAQPALPISIPAGATIEFRLMDDDIGDDELVFSCRNVISAGDLRSRLPWTCSSRADSPAGTGSFFTYRWSPA